jgi:hypothetical protein
MSVAGVWVAAGRLVWADAGECVLALLDAVVVRVGDEQMDGVVHVVPQQWVEPPGEVEGVIVAVVEARMEVDDVFPGAEMPALGEWARAGDVEGRVMGIDVLGGMVTIVGEDGQRVQVPVSEVQG